MTNFRFSTDLPEKQLFFDLFLTTGWNVQYKLEPDELYEALNQSWYCLSAYQDNILVGFGRMIYDGVVHALILDLIVRPEYQNKGIGKTILNKLVDKCRQHRIRDIQLFSVKGKAEFYHKCGFRERPEGAPGMEIKLFQ